MNRKSDDDDSTRALWWNYSITLVVLILAFITDWYFTGKNGERILDGALLGVIIGMPLGWIGAMNAYYFPSARNGNGDKSSGSETKTA